MFHNLYLKSGLNLIKIEVLNNEDIQVEINKDLYDVLLSRIPIEQHDDWIKDINVINEIHSFWLDHNNMPINEFIKNTLMDFISKWKFLHMDYGK